MFNKAEPSRMAPVPLAVIIITNELYEYHDCPHITATAGTLSTKTCIYSTAQTRN